jgi:hypothetical protein
MLKFSSELKSDVKKKAGNVQQGSDDDEKVDFISFE